MGTNNYNLKIKELKSNERPREKLINLGPSHLKINELLSIVLMMGNKKEDIASMTKRLLIDYGEKALAKENNPKLLANKFNLSINKSCQLIACFEIGKRLFQENKYDQIFFRSPRQVFNYLKTMSQLQKEQLRGLYLNSQFQLIHDEIISIGTLDKNLVHPREIFKPAISFSAAAVIIAHNHPSGNIKASQSDLEITKKIFEVSKLLEIELLDHLIIANNNYNSLIKNQL